MVFALVKLSRTREVDTDKEVADKIRCVDDGSGPSRYARLCRGLSCRGNMSKYREWNSELQEVACDPKRRIDPNLKDEDIK